MRPPGIDDGEARIYKVRRPIKTWWFCRKRSLPHGDGRKIRIGSTHVHKGKLIICQSGLHASEHIADALFYADGPILYRVECSGDVVKQKDKLACTRRKYLASFDATDMLREFIRLCALDVIYLWDTPTIVKEYLETGNESIREKALYAANCIFSLSMSYSAKDLATDAMSAKGQTCTSTCGTFSIDTLRAKRAICTTACLLRDSNNTKQRQRLHQMAMEALREKGKK